MKKLQLLVLCFLLASAGRSQQRPNIVFILADDLGYGDLGCYGQQRIATPNIDRLARKGVRFTSFYAGTSVCAPSRAAFMTGRHTGHAPVRGNREVQPEGQLPIPDSAYTVAELFQKAGYRTGAFGKWGLGFVGTEGDPVKQGFDRFYGYNCQRQSHNFFPDHLWDNGQSIALRNTPDRQQQYAPELIQQQALAFMEQHRAAPFFLYLAYTLPHAGLQLPAGDAVFEAYRKKFNEQPQAIPATAWDGRGYQPQAYPRAAYAAMVTKLDAYVGQVLEKLAALGLEKNTLVIFTSDNGPHREGGNDPEYFNSSGGFRGIKRKLTEGGIRVPMIVSWPAVIRGNREAHFAGAAWDFLPTFADILRQPLPVQTDGVSILPALTGRGRQQQHPYLYWEFHEEGGRQAARIGDWKGVRENVRKDPDGPIELYHLKTDPKEAHNVAAAHPAIIEQMKKVFRQAHVEHPDFPLVRGTLQP